MRHRFPARTRCMRMLIRVIGPNFVAGVVLDAEGEAVCKRAPLFITMRAADPLQDLL